MKTYQKPTVKAIAVDGAQLLTSSPFKPEDTITGGTGIRRRTVLDYWDDEEDW